MTTKKQFRLDTLTITLLEYLANECDMSMTDIVKKSVYKMASDVIDQDTFNTLLRQDLDNK